jgi:predicted DCC family thiol-disulfide oxidoreductase YuxK
MINKSHSIVLFDGVCNLCNGSVKFIIKHDTKDLFRFAALQSNFGKEILQKHQLSQTNLFSLILIENDKIYLRSTAILRIAKRLGGLWPLCYCFIVIPASVRNIFYDYIARNRYKRFGKRDSCMMPTEELKKKFVG